MITRLFIIVFLLVSYQPVFAADAAVSHCGNEEQVVFNCTVGEKILSVCMSKPRAKHSEYMQYRFGYLNQPELVYPKAFEPPVRNFFFSRTGYSGGGEAHLRFSVKTYDYIIYTKIISGSWEADGRRKKYPSAGMIVRRNNKTISHLQCKEKNANMDLSEGLLKEEDFVYLDTP